MMEMDKNYIYVSIKTYCELKNISRSTFFAKYRKKLDCSYKTKQTKKKKLMIRLEKESMVCFINSQDKIII